MRKHERIKVMSEEGSLTSNLFADVDILKIQVVKKEPQDMPVKVDEPILAKLKKGRVSLCREKAGRGGKTVTVLMGIENIEERRALLRTMQKRNGCGGTVKGESIEIQGDKRDEIANTLRAIGYHVVLIGG